MSDKTAQDWGNYWQGRAGTEAGAALIGVGIETDAEIAAFWTERLKDLPQTTRLLDLACGAGSVLRRANAAGFKSLSGVDISKDAIATLKKEFPNVSGVIASADETGISGHSFDVVASQFGFEYANAPKAAAEAARLLDKGGQFIALTHSSNSAIEAEVSRLGKDAKAVLESGFIEASHELFTAKMNGGNEAIFREAARKFSVPQGKVLTIAKRAGGLAAHLYQGTQTLYEKHRAYTLNDITGWLGGMEAEIKAFVGRMESMQAAALTQADAMAVLAALEAGGLKPQPLEPFVSKIKGDVIGWIISAKDKS